MKKTLIALAALAATGAFAQSTVSIYGTVDASLNYASSEGINKTSMGTSQLGSSKLGFKGTEDLGGGLKANFKLEGGLNNDSGAGKATNTSNQAAGATAVTGLTFQRYSYVGLSGNFGEVRLGRDYVSAFQRGQAAVDPFGTNGPADATNMALKLANTAANGVTTGTNAANMFGYLTPTMGGFSAGVQYFLGENNSNAVSGTTDTSKDGNGYSVFADYTNGPIFASIAQQVTNYAVNGDYTLRALSASYNFGPAKAVYTYAHEGIAAVGAAAEKKNDSNLIGVIVPVGAANIKASYMRAVKNSATAGAADETGTQLGLGVDYALSKRTSAYVTYARVTNSDGGKSYYTGIDAGVVNGSSSNLAIGLFHTF